MARASLAPDFGVLIRASGPELFTTFRALDPLTIHPLVQIRRDRESALIQRCPHFFQIDFS
jgi:hypothetical protein